ncbi:MAG: hypothetical protein ACRDTA_11185 [Pseudonocardiaceae bacterium]
MPPWVDARVRARSDVPDALSASAFWPFPDLALLELDGWTHHVCAPLTRGQAGARERAARLGVRPPGAGGCLAGLRRVVSLRRGGR